MVCSGSDADERLLSEGAFRAVYIVVVQMEGVCRGLGSAGVLDAYEGSPARSTALPLHSSIC